MPKITDLNTATSPANDDYFIISGDTNGTRNILVSSVDENYANVSLSNINSTAQSTLKTICGALPTTDSVVGQVIYTFGTSGAAVSAPSGGSWLILETKQVNVSTAVSYRYGADQSTSATIVAGGTQIIAARSGYVGTARLWRIA